MFGLKGSELLIRNVADAMTEVKAAPAPNSTVPSVESRRIKDDVDAARHTAISALNNDRFRIMLEQITDPRSSGALMTMQSDGGSSATDFKTAQSSYADNSE
jgi:hypothetical protein